MNMALPVLILILLEVTQIPQDIASQQKPQVLILILLEVTQIITGAPEGGIDQTSLNPYSTGSNSNT